MEVLIMAQGKPHQAERDVFWEVILRRPLSTILIFCVLTCGEKVDKLWILGVSAQDNAENRSH